MTDARVPSLLEAAAMCPQCGGSLLFERGGVVGVHCVACGTQYPLVAGVPVLLPPHLWEAAGIPTEGLVPSPTTAAQKATQVAYYERVDAEIEIERPGVYPGPARYAIAYKMRSIAARLTGDLRGRALLVSCCGSGMDAEYLAKLGARVVATDLSLAAVLRARERARRHGFALEVAVADAEQLPFRSGSFDYTFVHDGLHHLPDWTKGARELARVARRAVMIAEPVNSPLTCLAVRLGISGEYEDAGNFVNRLSVATVRRILGECGITRCMVRHDLIYYQHWTFKITKHFEQPPLSWLYFLVFHSANLLLGRWGNSLKVVGWKDH